MTYLNFKQNNLHDEHFRIILSYKPAKFTDLIVSLPSENFGGSEDVQKLSFCIRTHSKIRVPVTVEHYFDPLRFFAVMKFQSYLSWFLYHILTPIKRYRRHPRYGKLEYLRTPLLFNYRRADTRSDLIIPKLISHKSTSFSRDYIFLYHGSRQRHGDPDVSLQNEQLRAHYFSHDGQFSNRWDGWNDG